MNEWRLARAAYEAMLGSTSDEADGRLVARYAAAAVLLAAGRALRDRDMPWFVAKARVNLRNRRRSRRNG